MSEVDTSSAVSSTDWKSTSESYCRVCSKLLKRGREKGRYQYSNSACMHAVWGPRISIHVSKSAHSSPEVPKVTWWKIATFLQLPFTLANFAWNFATFQKNRTPAWYFSGDVSREFWRGCLATCTEMSQFFQVSVNGPNVKSIIYGILLL